MDEFTITVNIADRTYRLTIERKEEEIVRKAVRAIEEKMKEYARSYAYKDKQDLLAMVALQYTTGSLHYDEKYSTGEKKLEHKLTGLDKILSKYIDT